MTANQIGLANYRESVKHNRQTEFENRRHNTATETLTGQQNEENIRHNVASEQISRNTVAESVRHNVSTENINWYSARALEALQKSQASLNYSDVGVKSRNADITQQGQMLNYDLEMQKIGTGNRNAATNQQNADTQSHNLNLNQQQFEWQKQVDKAKATQAAINNATSAITSVLGSSLRGSAANLWAQEPSSTTVTGFR